MGNDKINIVFCVNDLFSSYIRVNIKSILNIYRADPSVIINFHILTDFISNNNKKYLYDLISNRKNFKIFFYYISKDCLPKLKINQKWPIQAWYRILIPNILPRNFNKILYLDADTLIVDDIRPLWDLEINYSPFAAVIEDRNFDDYHYKRLNYDKKYGYICTGVLLINLDYWRKYNLTDKLINWALLNENILDFPDQDSLNFVCRDTKKILPLKFGVLRWFFLNKFFYNENIIKELKEAIESPVIIHYAGAHPWILDGYRHVFQNKWIKINRQLKHPSKLISLSKGWKKIKMHIWIRVSLNKYCKKQRKEIKKKIDTCLKQ